jgi:hypothetical protein
LNSGGAVLSTLARTTAEMTMTTTYDTLKVYVRNSPGTVLSTPHTYANVDYAAAYVWHGFALTAFIGHTIRRRFTGSDDAPRPRS